MLLKIIRFLRGYVRFKVSGKFPERFINVCLKSGVGIFDTESKDGFIYASMIVSDYKSIRPIAKKSRVKLRVVKKQGVPFLLRKFRRRKGLVIGFVFFLVFMLFLQSFVWTIEINGVRTLNAAEIYELFHEVGFYEGCFKNKLNLHETERVAQLEFDSIGWMSINLIGTHAQVEIKEKAETPKAEYSSQPSNLKSTADGVIISTDVRRGTAEVLPGSAVSEGQLLVSGMYENALGETHFVDADAAVTALTSRSFVATTDEVTVYHTFKDIKERKGMKLLWFEFPLTFSSQLDLFSTYTESNQMFLKSSPVPFTVYNQKMTFYNIGRKKLSAEEAKVLLRTKCELYKLFQLKDVSEISQDVKFEKVNNTYCFKTEFKCVEDICKKEKLIVNIE